MGPSLRTETEQTSARTPIRTSAVFRVVVRRLCIHWTAPSASSRRLVVAYVLLTLLFFAVQTPAQNDPTSANQLKASSLMNFAEFVDWPSKSFQGPDAPFLVCVLGDDPFGRALDQSLLGKKVGDRPIQVGRFPSLKTGALARSCQIVFLSASLKRHLREAIGSFRGTNALLVGDTRDFAVAGGAIEISLEEDRLRFTINPDAAERAGLHVSSKLLSLARIVHDSPGSGRS